MAFTDPFTVRMIPRSAWFTSHFNFLFTNESDLMLGQKPKTARAGFTFPRTAYAKFAIIVAIGFVCTLALATPRTAIKNGQRITFVGKIGDKYALLDLKNIEETWADPSNAWNGYMEVAGEPRYQLREKYPPPGEGLMLSIYLRTGDLDEETPCGVLKCQLSSDHLRFDGHWNNGPTGSTVPLCFRAIASSRTIHRSAGWRVGNRGRSVFYEGAYPQFLNPTSLDRSVGQTIRTQVQHSARNPETFRIWLGWDDLWSIISYGSATDEWERHDEWRLTFHSNSLVSLLCDKWYYTGSAHPNYGIDSRVYWWNGHEAVLVQLSDFFVPERGWQSKLAKLCNQELGIQRSLRWNGNERKPEDLEPGVDVDDLEIFTIHQDGFRFHFSPYSIGSYAEGSYEAHVPFEKIEDLLTIIGPGAALASLRN